MGAAVIAVCIPIRVAGFVMFAVCGALCQEQAEKVVLGSLPDAPSAQAAAQTEVFQALPEEPASPAAASEVGVARESRFSRQMQPTFVVLSNGERPRDDSNDFLDHYLCPALLKRNLNYHPSSSDSFMGRAAYAASRIFVTHDETGKATVNTTYFLGVLSSAALHMAYRPYWNRSASAPFSDFGSTIGNDAGMNLLHEFRPGLEQLMKNHAPKFVSKIEERIGQN